MSELKPCPFVKAHGTDWLGVHTDGYFFWIECWMHRVFGESESKCCVGPKFLTEDEAIEAWNHRPPEDSLKAHAVEVLAEALTYYEIMVGCKYNPKSGSIAHNSEKSKAKKTAEARATLGWEE